MRAAWGTCGVVTWRSIFNSCSMPPTCAAPLKEARPKPLCDRDLHLIFSRLSRSTADDPVRPPLYSAASDTMMDGTPPSLSENDIDRLVAETGVTRRRAAALLVKHSPHQPMTSLLTSMLLTVDLRSCSFQRIPCPEHDRRSGDIQPRTTEFGHLRSPEA